MLHVVEEHFVPGLWVGGQYCLERPVGQGGMGTVWAARDREGRAFALKLIREDKALDARAHQRLLREARAATSVRHPNVAPVLAVLETDAGTPCLVMPLYEGESLRDRLLRTGRLPLHECQHILSRVAAGLEAVHAAGLVHRDVKPENVFLCGSEVLVLDFGIAKDVGLQGSSDTSPPSLTSTGAVLGTPHYMAPEQIFGDKDIDARADVWALGVMIFECVAGSRPTEGESLGQVLKRITTETLPTLASLAPDAPASWSTLVSAMLTKAREGRPTLDDVRRALTALGALDGHAPRAPRPPPAIQDVSPFGTTSPLVAEVRPRPTETPPQPRPRRSSATMVLLTSLALGTLGVGGAAATYALVVSRRAPGATDAGSEGSVVPSAPVSSSSALTATEVSSVPRAPPPKPSALKPSEVKPSASIAPSIAPPPRPSASVTKRHAVFESGSGRMYGMGPESQRLTDAVHASLPSVRDCLPTPVDDAWSVAIRFRWPKGGSRTASVTPTKNGQGQSDSPESSPIRICVEKKVAGWSIPEATGQTAAEGNESYLFANAGYRFIRD